MSALPAVAIGLEFARLGAQLAEARLTQLQQERADAEKKRQQLAEDEHKLRELITHYHQQIQDASIPA